VPEIKFIHSLLNIRCTPCIKKVLSYLLCNFRQFFEVLFSQDIAAIHIKGVVKLLYKISIRNFIIFITVNFFSINGLTKLLPNFQVQLRYSACNTLIK